MDSKRLQGLIGNRETGLALLILGTTVVVAWVDQGFLSSQNLRDILVRSSPTAIMACGLMLVVVTGEIDISIGSLFGLLAAVMGFLVSDERMGWPLWIGVPLILASGTMLGLATGALVTIGRVPSIVATLGLLSIFRGLTMLAMGGRNIAGLPRELSEAAKYGFWGIPLGIWAASLVIACTAVGIRGTPWGRRIFAVGSNPYAAQRLGLSATRLKLFAFANLGLLTSLAVLLDVPRLPKIESGIGLGLELLVVTCVVVGGVSITGGRGTISGVVLAVILMTMVRPVLTFLDIGAAGEKWTKAIQGGFIILAVVVDKLSTRIGAQGSLK